MTVPVIAAALIAVTPAPAAPVPVGIEGLALAGQAAASATAPAAPASAAPREGPAMQDIIVVAPPRPTREDPFARANVEVFKTVRAIDGALTEPAAMAFKRAVPGPIRNGIRNLFDNLDEPLIAANQLLQLHPGKAIETLARFVINSTVGWAGLFDVAKQPYIDLPRRPNGFADTLGYYGVKPGPYFFLPIVGPTNLRDMVGGTADFFASPLRWVGGTFRSLAVQAPITLFTALNTRAEFQDNLLAFRESERGVYITERDWYRRLREARIAAHKAGDHGLPVMDVAPLPPAK